MVEDTSDALVRMRIAEQEQEVRQLMENMGERAQAD